jgi:hypothetical protein
MAMHRRVPVIAATKSGYKFSRWCHVRITVQYVTDFIRVFLVHASKRQFGESFRGFFIKRGYRCVFGSEREERKQNQQGQWNSHLPKFNRIEVDWRLQTLGSARVPRVGLGVSPKQSSRGNDADRVVERDKKVRDDETSSPTRETRALPDHARLLYVWA